MRLRLAREPSCGDLSCLVSLAHEPFLHCLWVAKELMTVIKKHRLGS